MGTGSSAGGINASSSVRNGQQEEDSAAEEAMVAEENIEVLVAAVARMVIEGLMDGIDDDEIEGAQGVEVAE